MESCCSHGQQLLDVHGADDVKAAGEEPLAADLVHVLRRVERVPEHGLRPVRAQVADGPARAVDAVVLPDPTARRRHRVSEP